MIPGIEAMGVTAIEEPAHRLFWSKGEKDGSRRLRG